MEITTGLQNYATMKNGVGMASLRIAMDVEASTTAQLLDSLPKKDGAGKLVDVQA